MPFGLAALCAIASTAAAHEVTSVSLIAYLDTRERTYLLDAAMEVVPSADPSFNDDIGPEDAARLFAEEYLRTLFDENEQSPSIEIHLESASDDETPAELQRQQVLTQMRGEIPNDARDFLLYLHPNCPMAVVLVTVKDGRPSRSMQVVLPGEFSRPLNVEPYSEADPFAPEAGLASEPAADRDATVGPEGTAADRPEAPVPGAGQGLAIGFRSFFRTTPLAPAFAAALFLLTLRHRATLWQLGALLVAIGAGFAATLALEPDRFADAAALVLALALALLGAESFFHSRLRWWRLPLVLVGALGAGLLLGHAVLARLGGTEDADGSGPPFLPWIASALGTQGAAALTALAAVGVLLFLSRYPFYARWGKPALSCAAAAGGVVALVDRLS